MPLLVRALPRRVALVVAIAALTLPAWTLSAHAFTWSEPTATDLAATLLEGKDLPVDFTSYAPLTGRMDAVTLRAAGIDPRRFEATGATGWMRTWVAAATGQTVGAMVIDVGTRKSANTAVRSFRESTAGQGFSEFPVPEVPNAAGYSAIRNLGGVDEMIAAVAFSRGRLFYVVRVVAPSRSLGSASEGFVRQLAAEQWSKVPTDAPDNTSQTENVVSGGIGYLAILGVLAYLRDPLKRRHRAPSSREGWADRPNAVVDVSAAARRRRRRAVLRLVVQLVSLSIIILVLVALLKPQGLGLLFVSLLFVGLLILWSWLRHILKWRPSRGSVHTVFPSRRPVRVVLMLAVATALLFVGLFLLIEAGMLSDQLELLTVQDTAGLDPQTFIDVNQMIGIVSIAFGSLCYRRARRLGAAAARELLEHDLRPPVLYLRSFRDDKLKLRAATLERPALIERLSPRRYDLFEEVLARHLSVIGPVIAINPPGTTLPPLGAARETLPAETWQGTVTDWMHRSALIVFATPPGEVTPGLIWELQTVSEQQLWSKTLIIVPPVADHEVRRRWQALGEQASNVGPFAVPLPTDSAQVLALIVSDAEWTAITANRRNEVSYAVALGETLHRLTGVSFPMSRTMSRGSRSSHRSAPPRGVHPAP